MRIEPDESFWRVDLDAPRVSIDAATDFFAKRQELLGAIVRAHDEHIRARRRDHFLNNSNHTSFTVCNRRTHDIEVVYAAVRKRIELRFRDAELFANERRGVSDARYTRELHDGPPFVDPSTFDLDRLGTAIRTFDKNTRKTGKALGLIGRPIQNDLPTASLRFRDLAKAHKVGPIETLLHHFNDHSMISK
jgi:hypothetical protein